MVDGRERNDLYGIYEEVIAEMGFPVLSTRLPDSKKFRRDLSPSGDVVHDSEDPAVDVTADIDTLAGLYLVAAQE